MKLSNVSVKFQMPLNKMTWDDLLSQGMSASLLCMHEQMLKIIK